MMLRDPVRVVVVEDDPSMRRAIERILRAGGYETFMFDSAEATLEADALVSADCLILDINLPGMSGFELFEYLRPTGGAIPTILITAHDEPAYRDKAMKLGAISYHLKPFLGRVLLDSVDEALQT